MLPTSPGIPPIHLHAPPPRVISLGGSPCLEPTPLEYPSDPPSGSADDEAHHEAGWEQSQRSSGEGSAGPANGSAEASDEGQADHLSSDYISPFISSYSATRQALPPFSSRPSFRSKSVDPRHLALQQSPSASSSVFHAPLTRKRNRSTAHIGKDAAPTSWSAEISDSPRPVSLQFVPGGGQDFNAGLEHFIRTGSRSISRSRAGMSPDARRRVSVDYAQKPEHDGARGRRACQGHGITDWEREALALSLDDYVERDPYPVEALPEVPEEGVGPILPSPSRDRVRSFSNRVPRKASTSPSVRRRSRTPLVDISNRLNLGVQQARAPVIDVFTTGVADLLAGFDLGRFTCLQVMEDYLTQIDRYNDELRALTHLAPREDLLNRARKCDEQRRWGLVDRERQVLHGVPVVVKDNIATDEELGMPTTAGSFALLGMPVRKDAFIVRKLREAGAIIIAKANMSELASYKSANAGDGWSAVGGQTINVYAAHASPGTSSSGNGVALAAGFCPVSIGTETDGSITLPCLQSCLYGLKPTVGLLSRAGIVPFAPHFDTPGPMARDVRSLAIMMDVMQGEDEEDETSLTVGRKPSSITYLDSCRNPSFRGLRIGVPRKNFYDIDLWRRPGRNVLAPELVDGFEAALDRMALFGAEVHDPAEIPSAVDDTLWESVAGSRSLVVSADCNEYLTRYLEGLSGEGGCRSVEDIIRRVYLKSRVAVADHARFNEENADIEMPPGHYGQEVLMRCLTAASVDSLEYAVAKADMLVAAGQNGLDAVLEQNDLDAIICVREGGHSLANMIGAPIASVPIGLMDDNTPYGAYFIARRGGEQTLLRILAAWEDAFGPRPLPPIAY